MKMLENLRRALICSVVIMLGVLLQAPTMNAQKACFSADERAKAERTARVYRAPDPGYDPVLNYNPAKGPKKGWPRIGADGIALPIKCVAEKDENPGAGTTPKFHCAIPGNVDGDGELVRFKVKPHFKGQSPDKRNGEIYGEFLSSRFSKALGFFADDEWVADVSCPDCKESLTKNFQGANFTGFEPAAGIELALARGIDVNCNDKDAGSLSGTLEKLSSGGVPRAELDAFKLWLAFIDHGDTKTDNHKFACLKSDKNGTARICEPGQAVFYVSDMGSTFGFSSSSEKKARLSAWKEKDPIKMSNGFCSTTAKSVGDAKVSEAGRQLLATNLQKLLDAERQKGTITNVFAASRNAERDRPPSEWAAEFIRKANMIINARCSN
jgi:hypothetical protein